MGRAGAFILGFFALPVACAAIAAARPDRSRSIAVPTKEALVLEPGDAAFRHVPLHGAPVQPDVAVTEDGTLYVTGDPCERFDPATTSFVVTDKHWSEVQVQAPEKAPFAGKAWLVAPHVFLSVEDLNNGSPHPVRTALATNGVWREGPPIPENMLTRDAARLEDGTIALLMQDRGIWTAGPNDQEFHDARIPAVLANAQIFPFGPHRLLHVRVVDTQLATQLVDLETRAPSVGPTEPSSDHAHEAADVSFGAAPGGAVVAVIRRTREGYDRKDIPQNAAGVAVLLAELVGLAIALARVKEPNARKRTLAWFGAGAAAALALAGAGIGLLVWMLKGIHF